MTASLSPKDSAESGRESHQKNGKNPGAAMQGPVVGRWLQRRVQPGAGVGPGAVRGAAGEAEGFGGLGQRQPREVAQLDQRRRRRIDALAANRGTEPAKLTTLVRGELDWIARKALEKDRNRRYETASAFAADVQRYLHDEPVLARPPSAGYRLRKFVRRNKGRLAVAAGLVLAVSVVAASIGGAVGDRLARAAAHEQAEIVRLAAVKGRVRDSLDTARTLVADNKLAPAGEQLARARAQLGGDGAVLSDLAAEVVAAEAELGLFQQFLDRIDRAHQAETAPLLEGT